MELYCTKQALRNFARDWDSFSDSVKKYYIDITIQHLHEHKQYIQNCEDERKYGR